MKLSTILAPLLAAKASPDQIMALVLAYEAEVEDSKDKARARWRKWKEGHSTNVGKRLQTRTNVDKQLVGGDAHVEDKPLTSENIQKEESKSAPAKPSPRQRLETVLDGDHAEAVLDHRKRLRKPLTEHAAKLLAGDLAKFPDPNAAADRMIAKGWLSIDADWPGSRAGPAIAKPATVHPIRAVIANLSADMEAANAEPASEIERNRQAVVRVSAGG